MPIVRLEEAVWAKWKVAWLEDAGFVGRMGGRPGEVPSDAEFEENRVRDWWI